MIRSKTENLPKNAIKITLTIPWDQVKKTKKKALKQLQKDVEVKGFRKGNAPLEMVEDKIDQNTLTRTITQQILPQAYQKAIDEHKISPVINPKIRQQNISWGEDWTFTAVTAEMPELEVPDYQKVVKKVHKKHPQIWTPEKDTDADEKETSPNERLSKILEALLDHYDLAVADVIVDQEADRQLAQLLNEIKQMGMSLENYLNSLGKTADQLREEQKRQAEQSLKLDFVLEAITKEASVTVSEDEVNQALEKQKQSENTPATLNAYQIAGYLRRQKTLKHLLDLSS